ncbi:MAG: septum formation protein [Maribacter sp.]|jgi:septum formation protein
MLKNILTEHTIILASGSPRRKKFFEEMELNFEIRLKPVEEIYPVTLKGAEISNYLAALKATPFKEDLQPKEILITSDTVVWHNNISLAKAASAQEAHEMLKSLSGDWHEVITSVCFTTAETQFTKNKITQVKFKELNDSEIKHYVAKYKPFDKAGAYGIQEWIGLIGIEEIKGSYTNVVGLPTQLVYETLMRMANS